MITLNTFANAIQKGLNSNSNIKFQIFADAAEYKNAMINRTEKERYTNGIIREGASTIVPSQSGLIATQSVQLELCAQLPSPDTDEEIIKTHRAVLDSYFQIYSTQLMTDENDKDYSVAALYSFANTGTVEVRPHIGTSITFIINISYSFVEDGVNSSKCKFTLDGLDLPYTSARITRTPTAESNSYAKNNGRSTTVNTAYLRGFDFEMPYLSTNPVSQLIVDILLKDEPLDTIHKLTYSVGDSPSPKTYSVVFGSNELNLSGIDNGGLNFSLLEAAEFTEEENGTV